jgi:hypothetical protein
MEKFRQDNTEGYTDNQLLALNAELDDRKQAANLDLDDPDLVDFFEKSFADEVSRR